MPDAVAAPNETTQQIQGPTGAAGAPPAPQIPDGAGQPQDSPTPLKETTVVRIRRQDGSHATPMMSELADAYLRQQGLPPEPDLKRALALDAALRANDVNAINSLIPQYMPAAQPPAGPPQPPSEIEQLRSELQQVKADAQAARSVADQITWARIDNAIGSRVKENAKDLPYLSKEPDAATLVRNRITAIENDARARGYNTDALSREQQSAVILQAMKDCDAQVGSIVKRHAPAPPAPGVGGVMGGLLNDQQFAQPGNPNYGRTKDGVIYWRGDQGQQQPNPAIPSAMPGPPGAGGDSVFPGPQHQAPRGPINMGQARNYFRGVIGSLVAADQQ